MPANGKWDLIRHLKVCMKNQQIHQLLIQFINYVWQLQHVSALNCHLQGAFLVPSERCSIEEQSIEYCGCGVLCVVTWCAPRTTSLHTTLGLVQPTDITRTQYTKCRCVTPPEDEKVMIETCRGPQFLIN